MTFAIYCLLALSVDPVEIADYLQHSIDVRDTEVRWMKDYVDHLTDNYSSGTRAQVANVRKWQGILKDASNPKQTYYASMGTGLKAGKIGTFNRPMLVVEVLGPNLALMNWDLTQVDEVVTGIKNPDGRLKVDIVRIGHSSLVILPISTKGMKAGENSQDFRDIPGVWRVVSKEKVGRDTAYACELIPANELKIQP